MEMKPIPIGIDDFKEMVTGGFLFVDKTLFIKEFWDLKAKVVLIARPRRFGKTMSLSMMRYFFEKTECSAAHVFTHTNIWKEKNFRELQGTLPVVHLSFKDIKYDTWEQAFSKVKELLVKELDRVLTPWVSKMSERQQMIYKALLHQTADLPGFAGSIFFATEVLEAVHGSKVLVLIDEYDTPITHAYLRGYYEEMVGFLRNLFSEGLKGNTHLERCLMTGVVRTAKDGILSGLNNLLVCTMLDAHFSDKFGFIEEEVLSLLQSVGREEQKGVVKIWYNGYMIGAKCLCDPFMLDRVVRVYNPWSIMNYLKGPMSPETYWANTGSTELLERLVAKVNPTAQEELLSLMGGETLANKIINEDVVLLDLQRGQQEPWSFLFFAGYVTADDAQVQGRKYLYKLALPNEEIEELYQKLVMNMIDKAFMAQNLTMLLEACILGDVEVFSRLLGQFVLSMCSYHDLPQEDGEKCIHLFVLGILAALSDRYVVKSNLESGRGRYDIALHPKKPGDCAVVIEFKKGEEAHLEELAIDALNQVEKKEYRSLLKDLGYQGDILIYGIAVCRKSVVIKMRKA